MSSQGDKMGIEDENRLIKERIDKLKQLRELGVEPYPYSFDKSTHAADILSKHKKLKPEEKTSRLLRSILQ